MSTTTKTQPLNLLPAVRADEIERSIHCVAVVAGVSFPTVTVSYTAKNLEDVSYIETLIEEKLTQTAPLIKSVELDMSIALNDWGAQSLIFCTSKNDDNADHLRIRESNGKDVIGQLSLMILADTTNEEELKQARIEENNARRIAYFEALTNEFELTEKQMDFVIRAMSDEALKEGGYAANAKSIHAKIVRMIVELKELL